MTLPRVALKAQVYVMTIEAIAANLRQRMIDLYLDDRTRDEAHVELVRLARERGVSRTIATSLADEVITRWPVLAA